MSRRANSIINRRFTGKASEHKVLSVFSGRKDDFRSKWDYVKARVRNIGKVTVGVVSVITTCLIGTVGYYSTIKEMYKDSKEELVLQLRSLDFLPEAILQTVANPAGVTTLNDDNLFVHRGSEINEVTNILSRDRATGEYCVVYGNKGCGKTTLVDNIINGKHGVVKLQVTSMQDKESIVNQLANLFGVSTQKTTIQDFASALEKASKQKVVVALRISDCVFTLCSLGEVEATVKER